MQDVVFKDLDSVLFPNKRDVLYNFVSWQSRKETRTKFSGNYFVDDFTGFKLVSCKFDLPSTEEAKVKPS